MSKLRILAALSLALLLGGCDFVVLKPAGEVAIQQRDLVLVSTVLMLLIVLPVMALTAVFAWRYRQSNAAARYEPDWDHSTQLELVIWAAPLLIIVCLGALTWMGTHLLDPYRSLGRIAAGKASGDETKPLEIDVVALDWKWLFIYPEYGVASLNELAAPVSRPLDFHITASSVMNSFYVPALAGQIYAMPGMETKLHAILNQAGVYRGFSANYSGAGFSGMHFRFLGLTAAQFDGWIARVRSSSVDLNKAGYLQLERPTTNEPVRRYASVDGDLYRAILNMCVEPGKMCMSEMMGIDSKGGLGLEGINNTLPLTYDKYARRGAPLGPEPTFVAGICTPNPADPRPSPSASILDRATPLRGGGLTPPASPIPRLPLTSRPAPRARTES